MNAPLTYSQAMRALAEDAGLTHTQALWIGYAVGQHVPFFLIGLWQLYPEWVMTDIQLKKANIKIQISEPSSSEKSTRSFRLYVYGELKASGEVS